METKPIQNLDENLVRQLRALCEINTEDNTLLMSWSGLKLKGKNEPEISQTILSIIDPSKNITIDLANNPISSLGIRKIFRLLAQYHFSESIGICLFDHNREDTEELSCILNALFNKKIPDNEVYLDLGENNLSDNHMECMINVLKSNQLPKKLTLVLSSNEVTDEGANVLLAGLVGLPLNTDIIIDLSDNDISPSFAGFMESQLKNRKNIKLEFQSSSASSDEDMFLDQNSMPDSNDDAVFYSIPLFGVAVTRLDFAQENPDRNQEDEQNMNQSPRK